VIPNDEISSARGRTRVDLRLSTHVFSPAQMDAVVIPRPAGTPPGRSNGAMPLRCRAVRAGRACRSLLCVRRVTISGARADVHGRYAVRQWVPWRTSRDVGRSSEWAIRPAARLGPPVIGEPGSVAGWAAPLRVERQSYPRHRRTRVRGDAQGIPLVAGWVGRLTPWCWRRVPLGRRVRSISALRVPGQRIASPNVSSETHR